MIIAKLRGGLGNQMFIYAFARYLANKHNTELKLDLSYYQNYHRSYDLNNFNIIENTATECEISSLKTFKSKHNKFLSWLKYTLKNKPVKMIPSNSYILDSGIAFNQEYMNLPDNVYLEGLFQAENFFKDIKEIIKKELSFKEAAQGMNLEVLNNINQTNAVSLHIRRGDYITNKWAQENLGLCSLEYYQKAIKHIEETIENPHFFLFSDDIEWVKENLKMQSPFYFVDCNNEQTGYEDLRLMSNCKHHITANSSFSWWGAWLGKNENKIVIAPKTWFKSSSIDDTKVVPKEWIRL